MTLMIKFRLSRIVDSSTYIIVDRTNETAFTKEILEHGNPVPMLCAVSIGPRNFLRFIKGGHEGPREDCSAI